MPASCIEWSVFTKPWQTLSLGELGEFIKGLGFDGIELPVRPGYQVEPEHIARDLPKAAKQLAAAGLKIHSIAGNTDEATIAACGEAGVPIIRTMARVPRDQRYLEVEAQLQREYEALLPALGKHGVTIGIQNHCDDFVTSAIGLRHLMERFDPKHIAAVWDVAHCALTGEGPELAIDIVWSHLCLVNFKNAYWHRRNGPEAEQAEWQHYWTTGRQGLAPWPRAAKALQARGYTGAICLTAEYSDTAAVNRLIVEDLAYAKSLI